MNTVDHHALRLAAAVLGVDGSAPLEEARSAYKRLAAQLHPDMGGDGDGFHRVLSAWEVFKRVRGEVVIDLIGSEPVVRIVGSTGPGRVAATETPVSLDSRD